MEYKVGGIYRSYTLPIIRFIYKIDLEGYYYSESRTGFYSAYMFKASCSFRGIGFGTLITHIFVD